MASLFAQLGRRAEEKKAPDDKEDQDEAEKARKAKRRAEDKKDDEDEDEEEGNKKDKKDRDDAKASAARGRERDRVRAILTSGPGLANPLMAVHMALDTDMPRGSAVYAIGSLNAAKGIPDAEDLNGDDVQASTSAVARAIVAAGEKARGEDPRAAHRPGLRERMASVVNAVIGSDGGNSDGRGPSMADRIIAAGKKARGEH